MGAVGALLSRWSSTRVRRHSRMRWLCKLGVFLGGAAVALGAATLLGGVLVISPYTLVD